MTLAVEFDSVFLTGIAGFIAAVLVFCGSVFLLLMMILGARLAYFVTASITLAFVLIMGVVWSVGTPLGPVGAFGKPIAKAIPHLEPLDMGDEPSTLSFAPAAQYPNDPWHAPAEDDPVETARGSELETESIDHLDTLIKDDKVKEFEDAEDAQVIKDSVRLLEQDGTTYGMIALEPIPADPEDAEKDPLEGTLFTVMRFDPGNQMQKARVITGGILVLLVLHLVGLSRAEKRARSEREEKGLV